MRKPDLHFDMPWGRVDADTTVRSLAAQAHEHGYRIELGFVPLGHQETIWWDWGEDFKDRVKDIDPDIDPKRFRGRI